MRGEGRGGPEPAGRRRLPCRRGRRSHGCTSWRALVAADLAAAAVVPVLFSSSSCSNRRRRRPITLRKRRTLCAPSDGVGTPDFHGEGGATTLPDEPLQTAPVGKPPRISSPTPTQIPNVQD
eukprot:2370846-Pyramimonas_sp.AAC.1